MNIQSFVFAAATAATLAVMPFSQANARMSGGCYMDASDLTSNTGAVGSLALVEPEGDKWRVSYWDSEIQKEVSGLMSYNPC